MMMLEVLVPELVPKFMPEPGGAPQMAITGITDDSRNVRQGDLFIAVSGAHYSARQMLDDIKASGVAAVLCDSAENLESDDLPIYKIENLSARRGEVAGRFYGEPSRSMHVVAVTGTNGKTSCSQFIAAALNIRCGVIGTMGNGFLSDLKDAGLTTPDAISLQRMLATLLDEGAEAVCLEASSHGLAQGRLNGTVIKTAVFTNITRDHLDYHDTFDAYKAAKQKLFIWPGLETAVLNIDDPFSSELRAALADEVDCLTYSLEQRTADIYCIWLKFELTGIRALLMTPWGEVEIQSSLIGDFNLSNLLAVIGVIGSFGMPADDMPQRIASISNVVGRMDQLPLAKGAVAIIDYAHTPNALENALQAARFHCSGKLWCVMGCGGDRDVGKRPIMGEITSRLADISVVTDDNPRTEASDEIIDNILAGVLSGADVRVEPDRRKAIAMALAGADEGDLILIAGKGHETYQEISGERFEFSDYVEVERHESGYVA
ncbi:MAG: UDP-N-acetylmuramoyl-L-alanyl-D-glutamate--2,6-diaminopimelate ligase [Candidatus Azotimanducaceae bacterium]|jgi:UDP-N-acetylmuramoyl-L-alanyl-D-glutamate--2,6-diaminopimelate ligase